MLKYKVGKAKASGSQPLNLMARKEHAAQGASGREGWAVARTPPEAPKLPLIPGATLVRVNESLSRRILASDDWRCKSGPLGSPYDPQPVPRSPSLNPVSDSQIDLVIDTT